MAISYFGYATYAEFQVARLRTAHTAQLRAEFSITEADHCAEIAREWLRDQIGTRPWSDPHRRSGPH